MRRDSSCVGRCDSLHLHIYLAVGFKLLLTVSSADWFDGTETLEGKDATTSLDGINTILPTSS
jgi:hypothetical protein